MNTVPFNYDLIEKGYKVVMRNGAQVTEIHKFDSVQSNQKILAVISGYVHYYDENGKYNSEGHENRLDLVMIPPVVEKWINVYPGTFGTQILHDTEECAKDFRGNHLASNGFTIKTTYQNDEIISVELIK